MRNIIGYYRKACRQADVDLLVACAQMTLETGAIGSDRARRPECNPAGIGVVASGVPGVVFNSWKASVPAHIGRLLAYALPKGAGTQAQQSLIAEALRWRKLDDSLRGVAPTLAGLTSHWAADPAYATKIASLANTIRAI